MEGKGGSVEGTEDGGGGLIEESGREEDGGRKEGEGRMEEEDGGRKEEEGREEGGSKNGGGRVGSNSEAFDSISL